MDKTVTVTLTLDEAHLLLLSMLHSLRGTALNFRDAKATEAANTAASKLQSVLAPHEITKGAP